MYLKTVARDVDDLVDFLHILEWYIIALGERESCDFVNFQYN